MGQAQFAKNPNIQPHCESSHSKTHQWRRLSSPTASSAYHFDTSTTHFIWVFDFYSYGNHCSPFKLPRISRSQPQWCIFDFARDHYTFLNCVLSSRCNVISNVLACIQVPSVSHGHGFCDLLRHYFLIFKDTKCLVKLMIQSCSYHIESQ